MIGKDKLVFDTTDAATIAASDSVGAYVRASDGSLIGATSNRLHIADGGGSLTVDATDLDIRDLAFATDSIDVSGSSVSITGDVNVTQGTSPWVVSATNLDIRDLAFATDKVDVSGSSVSISGDVNVTQGTSPWVVSATDLDIRDLSAATDSVSAWTKDGSGNAITSSGGALDVNIQSSDIEINVEDDKANVALENTQLNVATSAALLASQLVARKFMWVQNLGNKAIFVGKSGVSAANGLRLSPGSVLEIRLGPAVSMHAVSQDGSNQDTRIMEAS